MEAICQKRVELIPSTIARELDIRKRQLRVAAYCRVSTDSEEQLNSYKSQIEYYTNKINENPNWTMVGIFADEGLSGTSTKKRAEFNRMIQKCKKGRIDLIVTKSISRFARNTLDCVSYIRMLRRMDIGIMFEKEGVNTMEMDDEIMITMLGSFAQAESESLSKNVRMGHRQSFKAGKVSFHYDSFLGYRKGSDGQPEVVPEEAETVKRIFHRYLAGQSISVIKSGLEADGIRSARGKQTWSSAVIQNMLRNERYMGDALLQKTFVADMLTKQSKKNNGELTKYYVHNNHAPIIDRDIFQRVQEEIARRNSKRKVSSSTGKTGLAKYSSKYALTELLVCGCCGSPYRRVTWTRKGGSKIVWRCTSRLEHGDRYCKEPANLEETKLHHAIINGVNGMISRDDLHNTLKTSVEIAIQIDQETSGAHKARQRIREIDETMMEMVRLSAKAGDDEDFYDLKFKRLSDERKEQESLLKHHEATRATFLNMDQQLEKAYELLERTTFAIAEFNDLYIRQIIDTVRVVNTNRLLIIFKGGMEVEQGL